MLKATLLVLLFPISLFAQTIDFSSVDAFWKAAEILKSDRELTKEEWDEFFATPYYKFYAEWEQRPYMSRALSLAFMPSKARRRDSLMQLNTWTASVLRHLNAAYSEKEALTKFRNELQSKDTYKEALSKTEVFLPPGTMEKYKDVPEIAIGIFQPDGNADGSIVIDLKLSKEIDVVEFVAHEAHHYYMYKLRPNFREIPKDNTKELLSAIYQVHLEAVADMIDKEKFLATKGKGFPKQLYDRYIEHHLSPAKNLKKIDSILSIMPSRPDLTAQNAKAINDLLPLAGHPHGYYMAKTIVGIEGKKGLMKTIDNPFAFFRSYNSAAGKTKGAYVFSKDAMNYLKKLEATYTGN